MVLLKIKPLLEGVKVYKKLSNSMKIIQKRDDFNEIPEKCGFGARLMILSKNIEKMLFIKDNDKIENSVWLKDVLRIFVPSNTLKLLKTKKNENFIRRYEFFIILQKNERLELMTKEKKVAEQLISGLNELVTRNKKYNQKLKKNIKCFCIIRKKELY